jgi:opacity protein-like surface antigen
MKKIILSLMLAIVVATMAMGSAFAQDDTPATTGEGPPAPTVEESIGPEVSSKDDPNTAQFDEAGLMQPDTDGWVYEGDDCDGNNWRMGHTDQYRIPEWRWVTFPEGWWYDTQSQTSEYYYASKGWLPPGIDNKIYYDYCEMDFRGAGYNDYNNLYLHEEAHSRGWDHWEEPAYLNAAYNEYVEITGY